ncbi:MAG TPA: PHP domain-containing protein [Ktedonobacteraceae bacterium]|nr:PHP domain-containing protein [Ktedonobacteraceae bacterium]
MTLRSDFHSHVARSSAMAMAQKARAIALPILGLSEHIFQMREARPLLEHMILEGPLLSFSEYVQAVEQAASATGVDVRLGLEVDFIPGKNEQLHALLRDYPWDFLIGSIHEIDGLLFEKAAKGGRKEGETLWTRYFALLREAVNSGYFSIVSHPVRMRTQNPFLPSNFDEELDRLAFEAKQCDVALEINGYDVLNYPNLVFRLATACKRHTTPISIGSDSHLPAQLGQPYQQSLEIVRRVGITRVRTWRKREVEEYEVV